MTPESSLFRKHDCRPPLGGRQSHGILLALALLLGSPLQADEPPPTWLDVSWGLAPEAADGSYFSGVMQFEADYGLMGIMDHVGEAGFRSGGVLKLSPGEDGHWRADGFIEPPEPARGGLHGAGLAVHENRLLVGDPAFIEHPNPLTSGALHEYQRQPSTGNFHYLGRFDHPQHRGRLFGAAVAADAGWLAVGAPSGDPAPEGAQTKGAVWLYQFEPEIDGWDRKQRLVAPDQDWDVAGTDAFGNLVELAYPWLAVLARSVAVEGRDDRPGAVYLYRHDPESAEWHFHQKVWAQGQADVLKHTHWLAFDGERVAFRTQVENEGDSHSRLTVFRHDSSDDQWHLAGELTNPDVPGAQRGTNTGFGNSPVFHGDALYVGEPTVRFGDGSYLGAVWKYRPDPDAESGWALVGRLAAPFSYPGGDENPNVGHGVGGRIAVLPDGKSLAVAAHHTVLQPPSEGQLLFYRDTVHSPALSWSDQGRTPDRALAPGETFTQHLRVHNAGPGSASTVRVRLDGPLLHRLDTVSLVGGEPECWIEAFIGAFTCLIRELPADDHRDVFFELQAPEQANDYELQLEILSDQPWEDHDPRSGHITFTVEADDDDDDSPGESGSSSGGCSLGGPQPLLWWMLVMAGSGLVWRRWRWPQ